jgi:hypothetical protein
LLKEKKDRVNLYAIILDCSAPYYMEKTNKYQCTMKLFDDSLNLERTDPLTATVFAKTAEEIPHVTKVGSIVRLHRVQTVKYRRSYIINCDITVKSTWVLFDPSEGMNPIDESGKGHTFTAEERKILTELRKLAKNYFAKHELKGLTFKQAEKKFEDFDVICYVMDVKTNPTSARATLCDADKVVKLDVKDNKRVSLVAGEVVRIRSANYTDKNFTNIELNEYSNVLTLAKDFKSAKELMREINSDRTDNKVKSKLARTPHLTEPIIGSKIGTVHRKANKALLSDLFGARGDKGTQKYFKAHIKVKEVRPKNPKEWIWVYNKKTKKQMTLDEAFQGKKTGKLSTGMEYFYKLQLYVQDKDSKDTSMYILMVSTLGSKSPNFINLNLGHEYPTEKGLNELKRIYKSITNEYVSLNVVVEVQEVARKQPVFFIIDTALTI